MAKKIIKKKAKNKTRSSGGKLVVAAGVLAAVAGVYFLTGKKASARREKARQWTVKIKRDVLDQLRQYEAVGEGHYHEAIEQVAERYAALKGVDPKELAAVVGELKKHWGNVRKEFTKNLKIAKRDAAYKKNKKKKGSRKKSGGKKRKA